MAITFFTEARFSLHNQPGHPEHAGRLEAIMQRLQEFEILPQLKQVSAQPATDAQLLRIHTQNYLDRLAKTAQLSHPTSFDMDTYIVPESYELARLAAGGVIAVVDSVLSGNGASGIAAVRPPGHHATPSQGMGFCLINNIAIAARHARDAHGLERVAVVDYDVHHGNGTQDAFYDDPGVLFISSHQFPLYPGTGRMSEIGTGEGKGFTLNAPLPPGIGDSGFKTLFEKVIVPALRRFRPEIILVSAGFDAHWVDHLSNMALSLTGFDQITRMLITAAEELCEGNIVFVTEGGYDLTALGHGWVNIANALLGSIEVHDPLGTPSRERDLPPGLIQDLVRLHGLQ